MSPRRTIRSKRAHCLEGALLAAAAVAFHGQRPLLLDFQTTLDDEDHVVAVYKEHGLWGAISKTNHAILRYRDPMYRSVRELAMSYAHEYLKWNGEKSLLTYSRPFDMRKYAPEQWVTAEKDLDWLVDELDAIQHFPLAPRKILRHRRIADDVELRAMKIAEWNKSGRKIKPKAGS